MLNYILKPYFFNSKNVCIIKRSYTLLSKQIRISKNKQIYYNNKANLNTLIANLSEKSNNLFIQISESYPVHVTQEYFINFHDITGLPWWTSIILSTFLVRACIILPLTLYQNKILAKLENLNHDEMPKIANELKKETAYAIKKFNWSEKEALYMYRKSLKKQWTKLIVRDNCHPLKATIVIWIQLPVWICLSTALRNMVYMLPNRDLNAQIIFTQLELGGFLWIPNLTIPDASFILPVLLTVLNLTIIEIQQLTKVKSPSKVQKYLTNFFRVLTIGMIPIASIVPSCMALYWVSSSTFGLIQNLVILSPKVKKLFKIPLTKRDVETPYQFLWEQIKRKYT